MAIDQDPMTDTLDDAFPVGSFRIGGGAAGGPVYYPPGRAALDAIVAETRAALDRLEEVYPAPSPLRAWYDKARAWLSKP